jgi:hypothetical protein
MCLRQVRSHIVSQDVSEHGVAEVRSIPFVAGVPVVLVAELGSI